MNARKLIITCAAGLAVSSVMAVAGPVDKDTANKLAFKGIPEHNSQNVVTEGADWTENFDSYAVGGGINGQGGWEFWTGGAPDGTVVTTQASSPSNSLTYHAGTDMVQLFAHTSGTWEFTVQTYCPSTAPEGEGYFLIILNQYGGTNSWSMQVAMNDMFSNGAQPDPWMIESQWGGEILPLILDEWVEYKAVIDLDNDVLNSWYGGTPLVVDGVWTTNTSGSGGIAAIGALDLYSAALVDNEMYTDDIALVEAGGCPCACDFDLTTGPKICDIFDFLAFQNGFVGGDPCACDIDVTTGAGICDIFDFLAFQNGFVAGCP